MKDMLNELDEQNYYLEVVKDLINIVMDFVENECPTNTAERTDNKLAAMICYANRSWMFYHVLSTASEKISQISENIEKIIEKERKT